MPVGSSVVHRRCHQIDMSDTILILNIINNNFAWFFLQYVFGIFNYIPLSSLAPNKIIAPRWKSCRWKVIDSFVITQVKNELNIKPTTKHHKDSLRVVIDICCGDLNNKTMVRFKKLAMAMLTACLVLCSNQKNHAPHRTLEPNIPSN